jgi:hypothetical protein
MTTKAIPLSHNERGGTDVTTTKAAPPSLGKQGGVNKTTMKAAPLSLDDQGGSNAMTTKTTSINSSRADFLALPSTDPDCDSVDSKFGLWVKCAVCVSIMNNKATPPRPFNTIASRVGRPFTLV